MTEAIQEGLTEAQDGKQDFLQILRGAILEKKITGAQVEAFKLYAEVNGWLKSKTERTLEAAAKLGVTPRGPGQTAKRTVKAVMKKREKRTGYNYDLSDYEPESRQP